jgi:hypothetical protein
VSRWLRWFARWPIQFIPRDAVGRIAVLDVRDAAEAIAILCARPAPLKPSAAELGGRSMFTLPEYLRMLRQLDGRRPAVIVRMAPMVARLLARLCDLLRITPYSLGTGELLSRDNAPKFNALPGLLNRPPHGLCSALTSSTGWDSARLGGWKAGMMEL